LNKYLEIIVIVAVLSIVLASLKLAHAQPAVNNLTAEQSEISRHAVNACNALQMLLKDTGNEGGDCGVSGDVILLSAKLNSDEIVGQVKNVGDDPAEFIKIGVTGYDADGNVVATGDTYSDAKTLKHNQKSSFNILLSEAFKDMKTYDLSLQWRNSLGVDEYVDDVNITKTSGK
jgi:hypothetical protein